MQRWRRVAWKAELDQGKAPVARLSRQLDGCQGAQKPELLTLPALASDSPDLLIEFPQVVGFAAPLRS
jgi:hypothetical protein